MTWIRLVLAALLAAAGLVVLGPGPAFACSCAQQGPAKLIDGSDAVFAATVTDIDTTRFLFIPASEATYHLDVETVYAGEPAAAVVSDVSGASCGLEGIVEGERYVFFAARSGEELHASLCGGTGPATERLVARVEAVTGAGSPPPAAMAGPPASGSTAGWVGAAGAVALTGVGLALWRRRRRTG